jgi:hypothetical protein
MYEEDKHTVNFVSLWFLTAIGRSSCHIASGIEMYLLRGVKTLTLVENVSRDTLIDICCVAGLCCVVMISYFLGNDATSVNAFYFVGCSQPLSWYFLSEADVYIAVIVLADVKAYKKRFNTRKTIFDLSVR